MSLDLSLWQLTEPQVLWGLLLLPLLWVLRERSTAGHSPWRSFGAMLGRGLGLSALLLALAQPYVETPRPDRSAVFVVDASASLSPERQERAAAWLEEAWEAKDSVPASILVAGEQVTLTEDLEEALALLSKTAAPRAGSDLRSLVELGLAALPPARHQEIVLLSDGASTHGEIEAVLRVASARDLPVHTAPLGPSELRAGAGKLELEQDRLVGEEVELTVQLSSNAAVEGRLSVAVDGTSQPGLSRSVQLGGQLRTETLAWTPTSPGLHEIAVRLDVPGDPRTEDNVVRGRVRVQPTPSALVVGPSSQATALRAALRGASPSLEVDERRDLPSGPYDSYSLLVLLDPELRSFTPLQLRGLLDWVHDGGRLLVTGGQNGLVTDEPALEELAAALPVRFPKTKKKQRAPLAVVYCLDSSDSMASSAKFDLAAAALAQSLHLLPDDSRVGIVGFADFPDWLVPLDDLFDADSVLSALSAVRIRGGTSIFPALQSAHQALREDDALVKHVVLLSDGQSTTTFARHGDIVTAMLRSKITVSTIAVSPDSDRPEMERIAEAGGGRDYYASRFSELPKLFLDEMMMVTRTNKVEEEFQVHPVEGSRLLSRVPEEVDWPPLQGYVRGEQRAGSELALATSDGHPVLVAGRHGRGSVVLLTTDVGGSWSADWAEWEHHPALWEGVVDALLRVEAPKELALSASVEDETLRLEFDAIDTLRNPRGDLVVEAILEHPDGSSTRAQLPAIGPGRYGRALTLQGGGASLVRVSAVGTTNQGFGLPAPGGELVVSVEPTLTDELRSAGFNPAELQAISRSSGGSWDVDASELFEREVPQRLVREARHAGLLWAALVLLLLDLAWRRLRLPGRG